MTEQTEPTRSTDRSTPPATDPVAWVEDHGDALYRYARAHVSDTNLAEDLVQETFLAALKALHGFQRRSSGRSWLVAILRRKISDHFRASGRGRPSAKAASPASSAALQFFDASGRWLDPPSPWPSAEQRLESIEFLETLHGCLDALPGHLADPFILREQEQLDSEAIRIMLDLSPANLRIRLYRARLMLRACLEKNAFGV